MQNGLSEQAAVRWFGKGEEVTLDGVTAVIIKNNHLKDISDQRLRLVCEDKFFNPFATIEEDEVRLRNY